MRCGVITVIAVTVPTTAIIAIIISVSERQLHV